jgi:hypothetical protein
MPFKKFISPKYKFHKIHIQLYLWLNFNFIAKKIEFNKIIILECLIRNLYFFRINFLTFKH